jgi:outer membrane immunogenic protein
MVRVHSRAVALVVGIAGVCGVAATASADGYERRPVAAPCCAFSWTGFYIGANGGYAWSSDQTVHIDETIVPLGGAPIPNASANFGSLAPAGGFAGIQAGANLQFGMVVLGFEADAQWSDIKDHSFAAHDVTDVFGGVFPYQLGTQNKVQRFGTFRPRLGLAWDKTLIYATGGLAWGRVEHTLAFNCCGGFTAFDHQAGTQVGYVVGGGLEHAFSSHLSLKVEYQYINLGSEHYVAVENFFGVIGSNYQLATDTRTDFHTVRLGLNYKLGDYREPAPFK